MCVYVNDSVIEAAISKNRLSGQLIDSERYLTEDNKFTEASSMQIPTIKRTYVKKLVQINQAPIVD